MKLAAPDPETIIAVLESQIRFIVQTVEETDAVVRRVMGLIHPLIMAGCHKETPEQTQGEPLQEKP